MNAAIVFIGILTFISSIIIYYRMRCADGNEKKTIAIV
jgi:hypothetical protein